MQFPCCAIDPVFIRESSRFLVVLHNRSAVTPALLPLAFARNKNVFGFMQKRKIRELDHAERELMMAFAESILKPSNSN